MEGLTAQTPMLDLLRERGVFERSPFVVIDVGCAGGIDHAWRAFGPSLVARGYDPDAAACRQLGVTAGRALQQFADAAV